MSNRNTATRLFPDVDNILTYFEKVDRLAEQIQNAENTANEQISVNNATIDIHNKIMKIAVDKLLLLQTECIELRNQIAGLHAEICHLKGHIEQQNRINKMNENYKP